MTNANGPRITTCVRAADVQISTSIDDEVPVRRQLPRGGINSQSLGDGTEIEQQRPSQCHGPDRFIQHHVSVARLRRGGQTGPCPTAASYERLPYRRIKRATGLFGHLHRELYRTKEKFADHNRLTNARTELPEFARLIKPCANRFDDAKPLHGTLDRRLPIGPLRWRIAVSDDLDGHDSAHHTGAVNERVAHFALVSASKMAW